MLSGARQKTRAGFTTRRTLQCGIVDSTGLENRLISKHYARRCETKDGNSTGWPKLCVICHASSHLIAAAVVTRGPSADYDQFRTLLVQSSTLIRFDRILADRGYDAEINHSFAREHYGVSSTVIPTSQNRFKSTAFVGKYRRQMLAHFPVHIYRERSQVECVFSRIKRLLGTALTARNWLSRSKECLLKVLTYNLMLLGAVI